jgi:hypothetical protein
MPQIQSAAKGTQAAKKWCSRRSEGHHQKFFFRVPAIALVDTKNSIAGGGRHCSASVPMRVAALWNEFWSERGDGQSVTPAADDFSWI